MPYIGNSPANNVRGRFYYTASASQTLFSGADSNGKTLAYQDGGYVDVYLNGVLLQDTIDYTATTKTSINLVSGATAGDLVEIVAYGIFSVADTVSALSGGTFEGAVVVNNNFTVDNGTIKLDGNYPVGTGNVALGDAALDDASLSGGYNTAIGGNALTSNTTAQFNLAVGFEALRDNTTGADNVALGGYQALIQNTTGSYNVAVGRGALQANTTASNSTAVGYQAGYTNNTNANTFLGYQAGYVANNVSNTFVGASAGSSVSTGSKNTIIGRYNGNEGGLDIRTSSNNIVLSDGDGNPRIYVNGSGQVAIGTENGTNTVGPRFGGGDTSDTVGTNYWHLWPEGNGTNVVKVHSGVDNSAGRIHFLFSNTSSSVGSITTTGTATAFNTSSDYRLKENVVDLDGAIDRVKQVPVHRFNFIANPDRTVDGFIAHEVFDIVPEAVFGEKDEVDDDGNPKYQAIDQSKLVPLLTAALKEAITKIETLEAKVAALETN
jgi:hypothetical protein